MPGTRRHKRVIKRLETECSSEGVGFRGISSDLSGGGLFVRTSRPFSPDTAVDLTIHLPGDVISRLKGIVRWAVRTGLAYGRNGMGIEIIECDQSFIAFINSILPADEQAALKEHATAGAGELRQTGRESPPVRGTCASAPLAENAPSPRRKSRTRVSSANDHDETDEAVDSLLSSLFRKNDKK
jgi:uncharacterized protein (TIGR02266 family)